MDLAKNAVLLVLISPLMSKPMRMTTLRYVTLAFLTAGLCSCLSTTTKPDTLLPATEEMSLESRPPPEQKPKRNFHRMVETFIPITNEQGQGQLKAEVYRPYKKVEPKTVIIMVPGSGNVSRRGELIGDGVDSYPAPIETNTLWAKNFADRGIFVLTYDKRTCSSKVNPLCETNDQKDIDQTGIAALAKDLDQVYLFAQKNLDADNVRILLMSTTQGAQTIALADCLNKVSGVILLSPVIGDLDAMWTNGLNKASMRAKSEWDKNQLLNRKESMSSFFASMKKGDFPETANVKGATAKFWMTWIEASSRTLDVLERAGRPTLLMFSNKDVFAPDSARFHEKIKKNSRIKVQFTPYGDRNFIEAGSVPDAAISEVMNFIQGLPPALSP